ncbi:glycosyl transferase [Halobacterium sp. DL1]|jgi:glycosyltransferase involved in cell wall biosynthesis|nr:glycosyl transferase [Halobacterium sp. DL1]
MADEGLDVVHVTAGIVPIHGEFGGGVERHVRSVTTELASRGHDVTVVDRQYGPDDPDALDGVTLRRVSARRVSTGLLDGWADHLINEALYAARLGQAARVVTDADVVHAHNAYAGLRAMRLARRADAAFAYTCHNGMWCADDVNVYERHVARRVEGHLLRSADLPIAVSQAVANGVQEHADASPKVIPNGVDVDLYRPDVSTSDVTESYNLGDRSTVLFVGRLVEAKGVDVLLRAARRVIEVADETPRFVFVGPNKHMFGGSGGDAYERRIDSLLDEQALREHVVFVGQVPDDELRALYAAADVFVLPSRFEAQGMVLTEALASGSPVVGTDVGGIPEVVTADVGSVVPPADREALADAIVEILAANIPRIVPRDYAIEHYSWERIVDEIEAEYWSVT